MNSEDENVKIQIIEGILYIHLQEHMPMVISSEKKYSKGVELDLCSRCGCLSTISMCDNNKKYCSYCTGEIIEEICGSKNWKEEVI